MKKIIIAGIFLLSLVSCITQKKCLEKFPPQVVTKDSILVRDTTIYVPIKYVVPGEKVQIHDSIPCPDAVYHKEVQSPSGRTSAKVDINKGKLTVDCKVDSLLGVIDSLQVKLKTTETYHSEVKTVQVPVIKNKTPMWAWILLAADFIYFLFPVIFKLIKK